MAEADEAADLKKFRRENVMALPQLRQRDVNPKAHHSQMINSFPGDNRGVRRPVRKIEPDIRFLFAPRN
jgi:hypothetical protein